MTSSGGRVSSLGRRARTPVFRGFRALVFLL